MIKEQNFTRGKIFLPMVKFAIPVLLAMLLQSAYGAADLLIVGQFGTAADVSAVSTGTMIMQTVTSIVINLAMGTTILMGQKIGEGKNRDCGRVVEAGIHLFVIIGAILTAFMLIFTETFCRLMNVPEEAFSGCVDYVRVCSIGMIFIIAYNVLSSIMRGIGNSKMPLFTVAVAATINVAADLLLVGVFNMAALGAAIATVFAQAVSVAVSIIYIAKKGLPFPFKMGKLREYKNEITGVLKLGTPIALQGFLVSLSFLVMGGIVNSLGLIASAGVGVAERLCMFIMLVPDAFAQSLSTFESQNIGAGEYGRAKRILAYGIISSLAVGVVMAYLAFFHGNILSGIFTQDTEIITAAHAYLKGYAIDTLLVSFLFCFIGYFNGYGKTTFVMLQGIIGAFGVRIPVAFLMSRIFGDLFMVALATPCSTLVQIILCFVYFFMVERQRKRTKNA